MVGGELTMEELELRYNPVSGFYRAPVQMIANGGILVIDDFGRQHCSPRDLLNRWIVPLESRIDFLTLQSGQSFEIPFMVLLVFATNLKPTELADEAFLRRIQYKIFAESPNVEDFRIFENYCKAKRFRSSGRSSNTCSSTTTGRTRSPARMPAARSDQSGARAGQLPRSAAAADAGTDGRRVPELLRARPRSAGHLCVTANARVLAPQGISLPSERHTTQPVLRNGRRAQIACASMSALLLAVSAPFYGAAGFVFAWGSVVLSATLLAIFCALWVYLRTSSRTASDVFLADTVGATFLLLVLFYVSAPAQYLGALGRTSADRGVSRPGR